MVRLPAVPRYTSLFQMAFRVGRFASGTLIRQRQDHTSILSVLRESRREIHHSRLRLRERYPMRGSQGSHRRLLGPFRRWRTVLHRAAKSRADL